jgi:hypothetical protein
VFETADQLDYIMVSSSLMTQKILFDQADLDYIVVASSLLTQRIRIGTVSVWWTNNDAKREN